MTTQDLLDLKEVIGSYRFVQAAALVGAGVQDKKESIAFMSNLGRLERVLNEELKK